MAGNEVGTGMGERDQERDENKDGTRPGARVKDRKRPETRMRLGVRTIGESYAWARDKTSRDFISRLQPVLSRDVSCPCVPGIPEQSGKEEKKINHQRR